MFGKDATEAIRVTAHQLEVFDTYLEGLCGDMVGSEETGYFWTKKALAKVYEIQRELARSAYRDAP